MELPSAVVLRGGLRLVTFDATNTLFRLAKPLGQQYRQLLCQHLPPSAAVHASIEEMAGGSADDAIAAAFVREYRRRDVEVKCFGAGRMPSREWWRPLVRSTFADFAAPEFLSPELFEKAAQSTTAGGGSFESLFEALWEHFSGAAAWELMPQVKSALQALTDSRQAAAAASAQQQRPVPPLVVGVVSDWDERLPLVLGALNVAHHFDFVNVCYEVGHAKPGRAAFEAALTSAAMASHHSGTGSNDGAIPPIRPEQALHIGDSLKRDVTGALEFGMHAVLLGGDASTTPESSSSSPFTGRQINEPGTQSPLIRQP